MEISVTTAPSAEDARVISEALVAHNRRTIGDLADPDSGEQLFVLAREDDGRLVGGLRAACFWNVLHLEVMWVSEALRGHAIGSTLLERAERFAIEHGYERALLETTSWQAKPFYEKRGYEVLASIPDYPKGHVMFLMTKRLLEEGTPY